MARTLKMFVRGKGVRMLQDLLTGMGYRITDQPGLFGVATRDAVKDFQSKRGIEVNGEVDDALMQLMRSNFSGKQTSSATKSPAANSVDASRLEALVSLLIEKELISEAELAEQLARPKPLRITEPPLT